MLSKFLSVILLSFVSGVHSGIIKFAFNLWLRDAGIHIVYLGFFNLIWIIFAFKVVWLPFCEAVSPLRWFGHRKGWLILLEGAIVFMTSCLYFIKPSVNNFFSVMAFALLYASITATKESMAVAYQMEAIKAENWGGAEGKFSAAYHVGFWFGGICLFWASSFVSWKEIFVYVSLLLFFLYFISFFMPSSVSHIRARESFSKNLIDPFKDIITRHRKFVFSLLAFIMLYRLQDRILMSVSSIFFLDLNFSKPELCLGKSMGIFSTIIGGLLGSYCVKKAGYKTTLKLGAIGHALASALFLFQSLWHKSFVLFYVTMIFEKFTRGFEGTVFFTYQMIFCSKFYIVTQFSLFTAIDRVVGALVGSFSGLIVSWLGWSVLFIFSFVGTLPSLWFLKRLPGTIAEERKEQKMNEIKS